MKKSLTAFLASLLIFLSSCKEKKEEPLPKGVLSIEKMAEVVSAIHLTDAMLMHNNMAKREEQKDLNFNVFAENNVKREEYYRSMEYYTQHPDDLKLIYRIAMEKLNALKR